jgi:hypothetical protein
MQGFVIDKSLFLIQIFITIKILGLKQIIFLKQINFESI